MVDPTVIIKVLERLKGERSTWELHWQEISDYAHSKRATFTTTRTPGAKRGRKQYDTTAQWANEVLANGLHGHLMNPGSRWFYFQGRARRLGRRSIGWMQTTENVLHDIFNDSKTNFHSQLHELFLDTTSLGTGILQVSKQGQRGIYFQTRHLGECYLIENAMGNIDGIIRVFEYDSDQVYEKWPETAPREIAEDILSGKSKKYEVIHVVVPREKYIPGLSGPLNMPFESVYILTKTKTILSEGGFNQFPFMTPRWTKRTGEIYGGSPIQNALADIKMVNEMKKEIIEAAQKLNRPPLQLPDNGFIGPIRQMAGGLNYFRAGTQDRIEALNTGARPDIGIDMLTRTQEDIKRMLFTDAFMMTDDSNGVNVKAAFVRSRREDRFRQLAPMLMRWQGELMDPCIARTYAIARDLGWIEDPPDELVEGGMVLSYVSPIQRSQQLEDGENIMRLMEMIAPIGEVDPSVWQNFNGDEIVRHGANVLYNIPINMLNSPESVTEARAKAEEQDQINQMIQQLQGGAAGLKDASVARKNSIPA